MALLFMDGFEHYATGDIGERWDLNLSGGLSSTYARTGSKSIATDGFVGKNVPASGSTAIFGFGLRPVDADFHFCINMGGLSYYNTECQCTLLFRGDGSIELRLGASTGGVIVATGPAVFRYNIWQYIEFKLVLSQTAGSIVIKVNGLTVLTSATNLDTCYQAVDTWTGFSFGRHTGSLDDLYVCDGSGSVNNDFLGECRVVALLPQTDAVAAGSNADFTPSTGTDHGALVDEAAPDDDTTYLSSSTLNHVDSWHYPELGYTGTIKGVQLNLHAKKTDSGTRAIAAVTRPASTNRVHATNHYLGTSYAYWMSIWELNPEDSAAWEPADIDAAEFGVKITV